MSRMDQSDALCDRWMDHLSVTSEASLPPEFKLHMNTCAVCRDEWQQLRIVWEALALDTEQLQVPETLKSDVMQAIFGDMEQQSDTSLPEGQLRISRPANRRWQLAAAACLVVIFATWSVWKIAAPVWGPPTTPAITATQTVLKEWKLHAAQKTMSAAEASIQLVRDGEVEKVVVQAAGLVPTDSDQAYQVWLLVDEGRYNCGTFRVDKSGKGVLVYDLKRPDVRIDGFGITLEPDALGTAPRGTKVLGTSTTNNPS